MKTGTRIFLVMMTGLMLNAPASWATPPSAMELSYDQSQQKLIVAISHPSQDLFKYYIRKLVVTKNNEKPQEYFYRRQPTANKFNLEIDLKAKANDKISVEAYASDGGTKKVAMTVPNQAKQQTTAASAPSDKSPNQPQQKKEW